MIGTFAWCVVSKEGGQAFMLYKSRYPTIKENIISDTTYITRFIVAVVTETAGVAYVITRLTLTTVCYRDVSPIQHALTSARKIIGSARCLYCLLARVY